MKLLRTAALLLSVLILMSACTSGTGNQTGTTGTETTAPETTVPDTSVPEDTGTDVTVPDDTGSDVTEPDNTGSGTVAQKPMASVSVPMVTESYSAADGTVIFKYTHQGMSLILPDPDVANAVILDFLNRIHATGTTADNLRAQAERDYAEAFLWLDPYQCQISYSPMRLDHGILSLYGSSFTYAGQSRPDVSYLAANYDLVTGNVLYLPDLFTSDSWVQIIPQLVIEALSDVKEQYQLFDDYDSTVNAYFNGNLSQNECWFFTQTGLCFYFSPSEIAPHVSGAVVAEIPYEKLTSVLDSAYFPAERDSANGSVAIQKFEDADHSKYTQISELILDSKGDMLLLHTDSYVQDIRITVSNLAEGRMESTVFASYTLTPGDAVMVQLPTASDKVTLYYTSGGNIISQVLSVA